MNKEVVLSLKQETDSRQSMLGDLSTGINPEPEYRFQKNAVTSSKLMILRRIVNHGYLALEPPGCLNDSDMESNGEFNQGTIDSLVRMSGKLHLLDRILQKLIRTGHKVSYLISTILKSINDQ